MSGARWGVVGGGFLGLTVALRLSQAGHEVTIVEAAPTLGGLASAWELPTPGGPVTWDRHYHVTLLSDANLRAVWRELGLDEELRWVETHTGYWYGGEMHPLDTNVDFLRLPGLRLVDKVRIGATILRGSRIRDARRLERIPVGTWLTRWSGRNAYERLWLPLLRAKLGDNHEHASAAFIQTTIARLYRARRSGLKKEMFGYVPGGYAHVLERFEAVLRARGVKVEVGRAVESVTRDAAAGEVVVRTPGGDLRFDEVVVTAAAPLAARLCPDLAPAERELLDGVRYQGIVCVSLLLRRPLSRCYLTYVTDPACPFTAVVEMTALVDPDQLAGHALVYLPKYVTPDDPLLDASDDEIVGRFLPYLREMHPQLGAEDVVATRVSRVRQVLAVSTLDYSAHEPPRHPSVPGLHLASSANVVNGTLNVDETIALAESVARELVARP